MPAFRVPALRIRTLQSALLGLAMLLLVLPAATGTDVHANPQIPATPDETVEPGEVADPLELSIDRMTPTVLRGDRDVRISGTVTNTSDEIWTGVNVAPFRSAYPITDSTALQAAAELPHDSYVGDRLTAVESITTVDELAPGESASFTTRLPRATIGRASGVYWVGVHASGETATQPRDQVTDGRARTFLPVQAEATRPLPAALLLELRHPVELDARGALADPQSWTSLLEPNGRLHDIVMAGAAADDRPITWLVDPAVPDAVRRLAKGNPPRSVFPVRDADEEDPSPPSTAPNGDPEQDDTEPGEEEYVADPELAGVVSAASEWLNLFTTAVENGEVLSLPYGDVDASALASRHSHLLASAHARSAEVMDSFGVDSTPALDSFDGHLSPSAVTNATPATVVLLSKNALNVGDTGPVPNPVRVLGNSIATVAPGIRAGGPGPTATGDPVAVRQRVASEVTLRAFTGDQGPLIVQPPPDWRAADGADELFRLFDGQALRMGSLTNLVDDPVDVPAEALVFGTAQADDVVDVRNARAADRLVDRGVLLDSVLVTSARMDDQVLDSALTMLSQHTRTDQDSALDSLVETREAIDALLDSVRISGPASVTLSGASGRIGATVTNDLPVPVLVNVEVESSDTLQVEMPTSIRLAPHSRHRLLLDAESSQQGVQSLTLRATDARGEPVGEEATFPVRSSEVTGVLWLMIGGGAVILFGAIIFRLSRRGLASRREQGVE